MSDLLYNDLSLGPYLRTMNVEVDPVKDDSGIEILYHRITIRVRGYIHPYGTATNRGAVEVLPSGVQRQEGDRAGITLANLRATLGVPRKSLTYRVGNDHVFVSPLINPDTGLSFPCDPEGGPIPGELRAIEVIGDRGILFEWSVSTVITTCPNFMISNRWTQTCHTDAHGFTTRTTTGVAYFNLSHLTVRDISADQFRLFLLVPVGWNMRRIDVQVTLMPRGDEIHYTVIDTEQEYNIDIPGVDIVEGSATAGTEFGVTNVKDAMARAFGMLRMTGGGDLAGAAAAFWGAMIPSAKANAVIQVHGQRNMDKTVLARLAINTCIDRFYDPAGGGPGGEPRFIGNKIIASLYVSQSVSSNDHPWCEARAEFILLTRGAAAVMFGAAWPTEMMNMTEAPTLIDGGPGASRVTAADRLVRNLPNSDNTRGTWVGMMIDQALREGLCSLPPLPPNADNVDAPRA